MLDFLARFYLQRRNFKMNIDVKIPSRGITAIFGHSGSGKTTLLRCISGLEKTSHGYVRFKNEIWQDEKHFIPTYKRPIAYVFQEDRLFPHLNVIQNIQYGLKRIPNPKGSIHFDLIVDLLKIRPLLNRRTSNLSGGERQRVGIARALMVSPRVLLMDEPLASLDRKIKHEILIYLKHIHQELEIPILYVSHSPEEILRLATHIVVVENGQVIAHGDLEAIKPYLIETIENNDAIHTNITH